MIRLATYALYALAAGALGYGVYDAMHEDPVYGPPAGFTISRYVDEAGADRIRVTAQVSKLRSCDLESGDGPVWVDFHDSAAGVPPPSAFYRPDGSQAGTTRGKGGDRYVLDGYTAIVPSKMAKAAGTFVVHVPCQLWVFGPDGKRVWGRKVIATWGPVPVPPPGMSLTDEPGKISLFRGEPE